MVFPMSAGPLTIDQAQLTGIIGERPQNFAWFLGAGGRHETCAGIIGLIKMDWNNNMLWTGSRNTIASRRRRSYQFHPLWCADFIDAIPEMLSRPSELPGWRPLR